MPQLEADALRAASLARLSAERCFDLVVIGGGATGLGIALDAATRGHSVVLIERGDFSQGTSSRSTKLVHGGVRYLAQGNIKLVHEALRERANLLANAPHIARPLSFIVPAFKLWDLPFYGAGLMAYDVLAGGASIGRTAWLDSSAVRGLVPTVNTEGLRGGIRYWDGQFDDARLAIAIARTAQQAGATLVNHCVVERLVLEGKAVRGVIAADCETGERIPVRARCVVNATGVWSDQLRAQANGRPTVAPSQGIHLSLDRSFLPSDSAILWPRTSDGRVFFAIPWLGKTIVGTTDSPRADVPEEPEPLPGEVDYLLRESAHIFSRPPQRSDILSAWVGLRPLVQPDAQTETKAISREHTVAIDERGLVTVTGGKWTTYRSMAQDAVDRCCEAGLLPRRGPCVTASTRLHGSGEGERPSTRTLSLPADLSLYGSDAAAVCSLPGAEREIGPGLTESMVRFAVRHEFARTVEDVLARRSRMLFLDANAALQSADAVAQVIASETAAPPRLGAFQAVARSYARQALAG